MNESFLTLHDVQVEGPVGSVVKCLIFCTVNRRVPPPPPPPHNYKDLKGGLISIRIKVLFLSPGGHCDIFSLSIPII